MPVIYPNPKLVQHVPELSSFQTIQPIHLAKAPQPQDLEATPNPPVHVLCSIMHEIVFSVAEAKLGGLFAKV
jgi:hypothetical protein